VFASWALYNIAKKKVAMGVTKFYNRWMNKLFRIKKINYAKFKI
jgi:hypothetical protein